MRCLFHLLFTTLYYPILISTTFSTLPVLENSTDTRVNSISAILPPTKNSPQQLNVLEIKNCTVNENGEKDTPTENKFKKSIKKCEHFSSSIRKNITVGYLTAIKGSLRGRQGLHISGAITMALEEINQNSSILPNIQLVLKWNDTRGDTVVATQAMTDMISEGVSAFFGPEGPCYHEAMVAQSKNIPMFGYITKSIVSLLTYYNWKKFSIVYEEAFYTVAQSLMQEANITNMSINDVKKVRDVYECCRDQLACCKTGWHQLIQETKNLTRIYVFLGSSDSLVDFMLAMQEHRLFENGEYFVIYADNTNYLEKETAKYIWKPYFIRNNDSCEKTGFESLLKRGRSLFVIVPTVPNEYYKTFSSSVILYNSRNPFNFNSPFLRFKPHVSIYAAYLYDSVKLYAQALDRLLSKEPFLSDQIINKIVRNGTKIVESIIESRFYQSITGATKVIDRNGDSEGNFTVLAFQQVRDNQCVSGTFSCSFQMRPVAQFYHGKGDIVAYRVYGNIEWAGLYKPYDEPICGFQDELCPKKNADTE